MNVSAIIDEIKVGTTIADRSREYKQVCVEVSRKDNAQWFVLIDNSGNAREIMRSTLRSAIEKGQWQIA